MCFPNTYFLCMLLHGHFVNPLYLQTCLYNAFILSIRFIFLYNLSSFVMKLSKSRRVNVWCFTSNCLWLCNRVAGNEKILSILLTLHRSIISPLKCHVVYPDLLDFERKLICYLYIPFVLMYPFLNKFIVTRKWTTFRIFFCMLHVKILIKKTVQGPSSTLSN